MTKKLLFLATLLAAATAFAQMNNVSATNTTASGSPVAAVMAEVGMSLDSVFPIENPTPECLTPALQPRFASTVGLPQVCVQSNGFRTAFRVETTDPLNSGVQLYINTADPAASRTNAYISAGKDARAFRGFTGSISLSDQGAWLYRNGDGNNLTARDFVLSGRTATFSFANSDIGNEGRPAQIAFYVYDRRNGDNREFWPADGYAAIPQALDVKFTTATGSTVTWSNPGDTFPLVVKGSSVSGFGDITFLWVRNDRENVTAKMNNSTVPIVMPFTAVQQDQPQAVTHQQFARKVNYSSSSLGAGTKFRVIAISTKGIAYDEVTYDALQVLELPTPPVPPVQ